jgi:hypothetical protein
VGAPEKITVDGGQTGAVVVDSGQIDVNAKTVE